MSRWKIIEDVNMYFVTTTVVEWQHIFMSIPAFDIIIKSLEYCIKNKGLHLHGYVIMTNHAHYIFSAQSAFKISDIIRDFNTHTSRELSSLLEEQRQDQVLNVFRTEAKNDHRGNKYRVWQEGFHPIAIEGEDFFRQKLDYLHDNPVRKGYVEFSQQWQFSSARNYLENDHSIIKVECL